MTLPRMRSAICALAAVAMIGVALPPSAAVANIPFPSKPMILIARGEPVRDFIADLFAQSGLRVKISTAVTRKINGTFQGTPAEIWSQIARAYNLTAYNSGGLVRVYSNDEVASRTIATASAPAVASDARKLKITDGANKVAASSGMVVATGVPVFLDRVESLAGAARMPRRDPGPVTSIATPLMAPDPAAPVTQVATPLLRANMARGTVRSEIVAAAGKRSPFEVRMFFLKYRDAADKQQRSSDRTTVVPGVATLLREQMGDGRDVGAVNSSDANSYNSTQVNRVGNRRSPSDDPFGNGQDDDSGDGGDNRTTRAAGGDLNGPRITADSTNNAVIVRDRPEVMPVYEQLIANFDIEPVMIETEITILEVSTNRLTDLGVDFSVGIGGLRAVFGGDFQQPGTGNVAGGYLSGNGDNFFARIRALEQSGALRVVSRPVITTPSNQVGIFDNRTQQFARLQGEREVALYPISYGLSMRVRPSAIEDGGELRIRMDIEIEDTRLNGNVVDGIPVPSGPRVSTQSIVRHGESVMLAGMTSQTEFDFKSKTPILGDVPVIGQVFRKKRKGGDRFERLFLLTPRIASSRGGAPTRLQAMASQAPLPIEALSGKRKKKHSE